MAGIDSSDAETNASCNKVSMTELARGRGRGPGSHPKVKVVFEEAGGAEGGWSGGGEDKPGRGLGGPLLVLHEL